MAARLGFIVLFVGLYLAIPYVFPFGSGKVETRNVVVAVGFAILLGVMRFRPRGDGGSDTDDRH